MPVSKIVSIIFISVPLLFSTQILAAAKLDVDETRWISFGVGVRASFSSVENAAPNGKDRATDFDLDNARIYINGQINQYLKFELNTECVFCNNNTLRDYTVLDAIAKLEINPMFNIWAGRLLVPSDRAEMSGPFYANTYDFNKTPYYSSDFSTTFGDGGAGVYGRDHGVNIWGALGDAGKLQYVFGVFNGLQSGSTAGPNQDDKLLFATRIAYNFLSVEKNPGYYTSSTYFGKGGDIFTVALAMQFQENGAGTVLNPGDFTGTSIDLLFEKTVGNKGVVTIEGEYKRFQSDYNPDAFTDGGNCFCLFDGNAWTMTVLYLLPQKNGIGQIQPYVRYTKNSPDRSSDRDELELGMNYIIEGHNGRLSAFYQTGDIATKGLDFSPTATGEDVDAFKVAYQYQF